MTAVSRGHVAIVQHLISVAQADVFIENVQGETAFDLAASSCDFRTCDLLEQAERKQWLNTHNEGTFDMSLLC